MGTRSSEERSEIGFFTTVPIPPGQGFTILVCPRKLEELHSYSFSVRCNRIPCEGVVPARPSERTTKEMKEKKDKEGLRQIQILMQQSDGA